MKRYNSFDEINRDLKYLRLKSKIDLEEMRLSMSSAKDVVTDSLSPRNLLAQTVAGLAKRTFYTKVIDKLIPSKPIQNFVKRLF